VIQIPTRFCVCVLAGGGSEVVVVGAGVVNDAAVDKRGKVDCVGRHADVGCNCGCAVPVRCVLSGTAIANNS